MEPEFVNSEELIKHELSAQRFDHEYKSRVVKILEKAYAILVKIPGADGTRLIVLVDPRTIIVRVPEGDSRNNVDLNIGSALWYLRGGGSVKIRIRALSPQYDEKLLWTGNLETRIPFGDLSDIQFVINSPKVGNIHTVVDLTPVAQSVLELNQFTTAQAAIELLSNTIPTLVDIEIKTRKTEYDQAIIGINTLQQRFITDREARNSDLETGLLGVRFDLMGTQNIFEGLPEDIMDEVKAKLKHKPDQVTVIQYLENVCGKMAFINGYAGCGKSSMLVAILEPFLKANLRDALKYSFPKVLITSPTDGKADQTLELLKSICQGFRDQDIKVPWTIIRMFAEHTEKEIFMRAIRNPKDNMGPINLELAQQYVATQLQDKPAAQIIHQHIQQQNARPLGLKDLRVQPENLPFSLASTVLRKLKLDSDEVPDTKALQSLKVIYEEIKEAVDNEKRGGPPAYKGTGAGIRCGKALRAAMQLAFTEILSQADIIVTHERAACESRLANKVVVPRITIHEEASKSYSVSLYSLMGIYKEAMVHIFLGDALQLNARILVPKDYQLLHPVHVRLLHAGYPSISLTMNVRSVESIVRFNSEVFCQGELVMAPGKAEQDASKNELYKALDRFTTRYGPQYAGQRVLAIDIPGTKEEKPYRSISYRNLALELHTLDILDDMLATVQPEYTLDDIMIMVPYRGAQEFLIYIVDIMCSELQETGRTWHGYTAAQVRGKLLITTIDKCWGKERPIVIYDLVATTSSAINERNREWVAFTRARDQLVVLYDAHSLHQAGVTQSGILHDIFATLQRRKAIHLYDRANSLPVTGPAFWTALQTGATRKAAHVTDEFDDHPGSRTRGLGLANAAATVDKPPAVVEEVIDGAVANAMGKMCSIS